MNVSGPEKTFLEKRDIQKQSDSDVAARVNTSVIEGGKPCHTNKASSESQRGYFAAT